MMQRTRASSHVLAFLPTLDPQALAEVMVAFANTDGGTIVLGYDDRGRPTIDVAPEDIEAALRQAASLTSPPVMATIESSGDSHAPHLVVRVPRSIDLHSTKDGRVLVRAAGENRVLTGEEIRHLTQSKSLGDYEAETVPAATLQDFDDDVVAEYIAKREARTRRKIDLAERTAAGAATLLQEIGALDMRGQPTVAGILLFGKNPQAFLPQSGVVFVKFRG